MIMIHKEMTIKEANNITGGLSNTSKLPCSSFGLPVSKCITGSKLAKIKGTSCYSCYANKGMYRFSNVISAQNKRHKNLNNDRYVEGMIFLLNDQFYKKKINVFRWFDSGDLQSLDHLEKIILIAQKMPYIKFWLPTRS